MVAGSGTTVASQRVGAPELVPNAVPPARSSRATTLVEPQAVPPACRPTPAAFMTASHWAAVRVLPVNVNVQVRKVFPGSDPPGFGELTVLPTNGEPLKSLGGGS